MTRSARTTAPGIVSRRGTLLPGLLMLATYAALAVLGAPLANSAFVAKITNSAATASTAGYFTCTSAARGGGAYFAYPLNDTSATNGVTDVSGNNRPGTYGTGITYGADGPCPRDGAKAVTLDGSTGYVTGAAQNGPQAFSVEIWFKTTVGGGKLIGFGGSATGASGQYDRHLYLSNNGTLTFGVYTNTVKTITSTASYLNGKWHNAIATLAPATDPNPGIRLYVDGTLVASDPTVTSAEPHNGYWRIGYDNLANWGTTQPSNFYFTGSLAYASVYTSVLTPAAVAAHHRAGT